MNEESYVRSKHNQRMNATYIAFYVFHFKTNEKVSRVIYTKDTSNRRGDRLHEKTNSHS